MLPNKKEMTIIRHSNDELVNMLKPKKGSELISNGRMAQFIAQAIEVTIP